MLEPEICFSANESRPPFPRPEGSWKRMPVICPRCQSKSDGRAQKGTHHDDECITREEPSVHVRDNADSEGAAKASQRRIGIARTKILTQQPH